MVFSSENLEIWGDSRDYSHPIPTATCPPFTKGTQLSRLSQKAWGRRLPHLWGACLSSSHIRPSRGRHEQSGGTTYRPLCGNFSWIRKQLSLRVVGDCACALPGTTTIRTLL